LDGYSKYKVCDSDLNPFEIREWTSKNTFVCNEMLGKVYVYFFGALNLCMTAVHVHYDIAQFSKSVPNDHWAIKQDEIRLRCWTGLG